MPICQAFKFGACSFYLFPVEMLFKHTKPFAVLVILSDSSVDVQMKIHGTDKILTPVPFFWCSTCDQMKCLLVCLLQLQQI